MSIDPRAILIFRAVCKSKSISGAARDLNLSQPSVSVAMSRLEDMLGVSLFTRQRTGIQLTAEGASLAQYSETLSNLLVAAEKDIKLVGQNSAGSIVIGGTPGALSTLVPPIIASLSRKIPSFQLQIIEGADSQLESMLRKRSIDLAVVTAGSNRRPDDIEELPLIRDPFAMIVGRENDHLPDTVKMEDVSKLPWVLPNADGAFHRQIDALFLGAGVKPPLNVIRCDSLLTTKAIVRKTDYVTILPKRVNEVELRRGSLRAITIQEANIKRQVGLLWLKDGLNTPLAEHFIQEARQVVEE